MDQKVTLPLNPAQMYFTYPALATLLALLAIVCANNILNGFPTRRMRERISKTSSLAILGMPVGRTCNVPRSLRKSLHT